MTMTDFRRPGMTNRDAEHLVSRTWPERRKFQSICTIDIDLSDRRRPAVNMENTLILQAFKQNHRRFSGSGITGFDELEGDKS